MSEVNLQDCDLCGKVLKKKLWDFQTHFGGVTNCKHFLGLIGWIKKLESELKGVMGVVEEQRNEINRLNNRIKKMENQIKKGEEESKKTEEEIKKGNEKKRKTVKNISKIVEIKLKSKVQILLFLFFLSFIYYVNKIAIEISQDLGKLILTDKEMMIIQKWLPNPRCKLEKLFDGKRDGFDVKQFHSKCDNKGPTLVIVLSEFGHVFGGYTKISWTSKEQYVKDESAFVFIVRSQKGTPPTKYKIKTDQIGYTVYHGPGKCLLFIVIISLLTI
jgi:hypothetical protein